MMRIVAAHEYHALGPVRHAETQRIFDQMAGHFRVRAVEHDMSQLDRQVSPFDRRDFLRIDQKAQQFALRQFHDDAMTATQVFRHHRRGIQPRCADQALELFQPVGGADEGRGAHIAIRRFFQRDQIRIVARPAQIVGCALDRRRGHAPDVGQEGGRLRRAGQRQFDAAQLHLASPWVRPAAKMPAMAQASSQLPVSPLIPTAPMTCPVLGPSNARIRTPPGDRAS